MNHLEELTAEWLNYNRYFVRTAVRVGKRAKGGWDGELDVVAFHPSRQHFLHVECSIDAHNWDKREARFVKKFDFGRKHARELFSGMNLPTSLDQVVVHGYLSAPERHRVLGGGRLITSEELTAEIMHSLPERMWSSAVPEQFPLLRTLQIAKMAGARVPPPAVFLLPEETTRS
jgi:hypothetical protein